MKEYRKKIIITSLITLIPIVIGLLLWNKLPDRIATHFGAHNMPDGWSSKVFAVFGLPIILFVLHLMSLCVILNDPKKRNVGTTLLSVIFWMIPMISVVVNSMIYGVALGMKIDIRVISTLMMSVMFIIFGNYMSKNRQNYTVGIRLPWTLASEENWYKTHSIASKVWVAGGIALFANVFIGQLAVMLIVVIVTTITPVIYSFALYRKEMKQSK